MSEEHEHRWEIRVRTGVGTDVLATAGSPQALGLALTTLHEEHQLDGFRVGVRDAERKAWVISPFTIGANRVGVS